MGLLVKFVFSDVFLALFYLVGELRGQGLVDPRADHDDEHGPDGLVAADHELPASECVGVLSKPYGFELDQGLNDTVQAVA